MKILLVILAVCMVALSMLVASMAKEINKLKKFVENEDEMMGQVAEAIAGFMDICNSVSSMANDLAKTANIMHDKELDTESNDEELEEWLK